VITNADVYVLPVRYAGLVDSQIEIVYGCGGQSISLYACYRGERVGYAWLSIDGTSAELIDINVYRRESRWSWRPPFYYLGVDYRGKGIGTQLLTTAIGICETQDLHILIGDMHGDIERLSIWFQQNGFQVGPGFAIQREIQRVAST
jgi:GNAT superfamily N-acetyltransferase